MDTVGRALSNTAGAGSALRELRFARQEVRQGQFQRSMALVTAFAAIVSGFEAYIQHQRGAFANRLMWTPVLSLTPTAAVAVAAIFSRPAARTLLPLASLVSLADGIAGFLLHLRGIRRLPGGFALGQYNIVMGPPVFAPLLLCSVGILGLIASFLRREVLHPLGLVSRAATRALAFAAEHETTGSTVRAIAEEVSYGRFQRGMALVAGFLMALAGGEVYFEHLHGSFNQRAMWLPVWATPPMVAATIGAYFSESAAARVLPLTSLGSLGVGLLGVAAAPARDLADARGAGQPAVQHHHGSPALRAPAVQRFRIAGPHRLAAATGRKPVMPSGRYPGYDALSQRGHWDPATRRVILDRVYNVPDTHNLDPHQRATLEALCDRVIPQAHRPPDRRVPIAPWIDSHSRESTLNGYQFEDMPANDEAWRLGLEGLDQTAESLFNRQFVALAAVQQDAVLNAVRAGNPPGEVWQRMPAARWWLTSPCARSPASTTPTPTPGMRSASAGRPTRAATLR